ncbi:MAG: class I SAM-dependent methyltransferase [Acidobacteriota bacterium]
MENAYNESAAARRYDSARSLPPETNSLWLEALRSSMPLGLGRVLDLGCGTGRFTRGLAETFGCPVVGVEPSAAMLKVAISRGEGNVEWKQGSAENIPLESQSVDLVYMSQVFHHLSNPQRALAEIDRVLTPTGYLAIRNGTREHNPELVWLKFFPEAWDIEEQRTPYAHEIEATVTRQQFVNVSHQTIHQLFASSYTEYFEKISRRGLSALIAISDATFDEGLERFKHWVGQQPRDAPVYEPVDFFVFQKETI